MEFQPTASQIISLTVNQEMNKHSKVELSIKVSGKEILDMDKENKFGKMEPNTLAPGKMEKLMDTESSSTF